MKIKPKNTTENAKKSNAGITLIALVITIIILLILAGVAIVILTGDNGLLTKTGDVRNTNINKEIEEEVRLAWNKSYIDRYMDKNTNIEKLVADELGISESAVTLSANGKELSVTYKGRTVKIDTTTGKTIEIKVAEAEETMPVYNPETLTLQGTPKNTDKYGWKVKNYTVRTNEFTTGVWRLFYQDENYAYLITDECVGSYVPKTQYTGKYTSGEDISTEGKKLNAKVSTLFTDESKKSNNNILATVWLTDTSTNGTWASYKNSDAVFAIGSPTAELFAASYNNRSNKTSNQINVDLGIYGYTNYTEINWIKTDENHGIYNKNTTSYWWLASPGDERRIGGDSELYLDGYSGCLNYDYVDDCSYAVRPVVCIQTSVFDKKYATAENLVNEN